MKEKKEEEIIEGLLEKGMIVLKVHTTQLYTFKQGAVNGWEAEDVIEDWFYNGNLHSSHATRDIHKIGHSKKVKNIEIYRNKAELENLY